MIAFLLIAQLVWVDSAIYACQIHSTIVQSINDPAVVTATYSSTATQSRAVQRVMTGTRLATPPRALR